jgi:hypothetical protein
MLRLVEACKKRDGPTVTISSPPATELKDQIWRRSPMRSENNGRTG